MKRVAKRTLVLILIVFATLAIPAILLVLWIHSSIPSDKEIRGCIKTKMYAVELCPTNPKYVKLSGISENLQKAVILTEDSAFYSHRGFDFQEMENSLKKNLEKGHYARGGSTITQQLAKNMFLTKDKTLFRKLLEALITLRLEKVLTKKEILEKYLNVVQFGKDLFGTHQAARFYFHKQASELSVVESAFLAFLLPSPEKYSKSFFKGELTPFARARITQIIDRLYDYKRISEDDYLMARTELDTFLAGKEESSDINYDEIHEEDIQPEED